MSAKFVSLPDFQSARRDVPAGIVVFLVALPLCLGIALASGAPLFAGIVAGVVGGIVLAFCSGSELSVSGPAATSFRLPDGFNLNAPLRFADVTVFLSVGVFPLTGGSDKALSSNAEDFLSANNFTDANSGPTVDAFNLANANRPFSFSLINDTTASLQGLFFAQAGASGLQIAPPAPVPEASAAWLMAAGLAGLLWQRRRAPGR